MDRDEITLFLGGDVMTGRGIDQVLPHACPPELYEGYVRDAREYVALAERANGPIPRPVDFDYIWGDALAALAQIRPDLRIANLETAVTRCPNWAPKGINYRMHPANIPCLTAAGIDCCVLANNHVLDWGGQGLEETLTCLRTAGICTAGAGFDADEAGAPAVLAVPEGRLLVFAAGFGDSGIPAQWTAEPDAPGVARLQDLSPRTVDRFAAGVRSWRREGDLVVVSIHWGGNWGYRIPDDHTRFARALIDAGAADVIHGHSSHHVKGIEVYRGRLILYGCGDLLTDYEGIGGHEQYRSELGLMYFPVLHRPSGRLAKMEMVPTRMRRFRIEHAAAEEADWLRDVLSRESAAFGVWANAGDEQRLTLGWAG